MSRKVSGAGLIVAAVALLYAFSAAAECGPQCQAVCQGGSGGGCPGGGGGRGPSAYTQWALRYNQAVDVYNEGIDAMRAERYSDAAWYFRRALEIEPTVKNGQTQLLFAEGFQAYVDRDFTGAISYYQQVLRIDPGNRSAKYHIDQANAAITALQGYAAWNNGDLATALADYQKAYSLDASQTYSDNIKAIQSQLQTQQVVTARAQTSQAVSRLIDAVATSQINTASTASGLDFKSADNGALKTGSTSTTGPFGDPVSQPHLTPLAVPAAGPGDDTKAGDQLLAAARDAKNGSDLTPNYDTGQVQSAGSLSTAAQNMGQTPGTADLIAHVGAGMQNEGVRTNVAYYQKLDGLKIEAQAQLAEVQQKLDRGEGDAQALKARKADLTGAISHYKSRQTATKAQIKQQMTEIHVAWIESPAPAQAPQPAAKP